jgi:RND family efflux transporter MFP subunit
MTQFTPINPGLPIITQAEPTVADRELKPVATKRPSVVGLVVISGLVVVGFAALGAAGLNARSRQSATRDGTTAATKTDRPRVLTTLAARAPDQVEQVLPGTAYPLLETAVYARTSGYLRRWLVDIGDSVTEGQLLAEIETPEVDGQLLQARAALVEAKATVVRNRASENLARVSLDRNAQLVRTSAISRQEYDEAEAALKVATATVHVSEAAVEAGAANVRRLEDLQRFQKVTAPFAGIVTARNFDPGALVVADNAAGREMFHLARIDTLRVFADVPQTFATAVRAGQEAPVSRREVPGREFAGKVARTTGSVDPRTRTLRVEVEVPNKDGALMPGMYLQVRFRLDAPTGVVRVPGAAVVVRADGAKVAVLDTQGSIHYRPVQLGRDYGQSIEVVSGLSGGETLVVRPGDDLPDGTVVEPATASAQ